MTLGKLACGATPAPRLPPATIPTRRTSAATAICRWAPPERSPSTRWPATSFGACPAMRRRACSARGPSGRPIAPGEATRCGRGMDEHADIGVACWRLSSWWACLGCSAHVAGTTAAPRFRGGPALATLRRRGRRFRAAIRPGASRTMGNETQDDGADAGHRGLGAAGLCRSGEGRGCNGSSAQPGETSGAAVRRLALTRWCLGSVAEAVVRLSPVPISLVRTTPPERDRIPDDQKGHGGERRWLLVSVAEKLVRHAATPVLRGAATLEGTAR
jgi:hypothetical protein